MSEISKTPEPISLETGVPGLVLTQMLTEADDQAYFELQNANLDYWQEFGNAIDQTPQSVRERRLEHGDGRFGIWLDDKLVGMVGYSTKHSPDEVEIGILLDKEAAGHGYGSEAVRTLTNYAVHRFKRVYAEVSPDNERSIRLLKRVGYQSSRKISQRDWGPALVFDAPDQDRHTNQL
jgi:RimJ/RimL family protein N-acetyltransferase